MSKSYYIHSSLRSVKNRYKLLKIYSRKSTILPIHVGLTVLIYNGKIFQKKRILYGMIGHKFGEFALTRKINTQRNKN